MPPRAEPKIVVVDEAGRRTKALAVVTPALVRRLARAALAHENVKSGELTVLITRDAAIRKLNRKFRGKDKPTNVLSFPSAAGEGRVGDIAISLDYVAKQGRETGAGFRFTFAYYLVHGILHLLGWDHLRAAEAKQMYRRTDEILERAGERALR